MLIYNSDKSHILDELFSYPMSQRVDKDSLKLELNRAFTLFPVNTLIYCYFLNNNVEDILITIEESNLANELDFVKDLLTDSGLNVKFHSNQNNFFVNDDMFQNENLVILSIGIKSGLNSYNNYKKTIDRLLNFIEIFENSKDM